MMITTITITNERQAKRMERERNRFSNGKWCRCKIRRINHIYFAELEIDNRCSIPARNKFDGSIQAYALHCCCPNASKKRSDGMNDTTKPIVSARNVTLCTRRHTHKLQFAICKSTRSITTEITWSGNALVLVAFAFAFALCKTFYYRHHHLEFEGIECDAILLLLLRDLVWMKKWDSACIKCIGYAPPWIELDD